MEPYKNTDTLMFFIQFSLVAVISFIVKQCLPQNYDILVDIKKKLTPCFFKQLT